MISQIFWFWISLRLTVSPFKLLHLFSLRFTLVRAKQRSKTLARTTSAALAFIYMTLARWT
jgi:hypothetical protein